MPLKIFSLPAHLRKGLGSIFILLLAACEPGATNTRSSAQSHATASPEVPLPAGTIPADKNFRVVVAELAENGLMDGIAVHHLHESPTNELLLVEINQDNFVPILINAAHQGVTILETPDVPERLSVAIGSGFVTDEDPLQPLGLLMAQGHVISPVEPHGYTRILGISDHRLSVVHKSAFTTDRFHSALQLGPGIIEQGMLDISERDLQRPRYFRAVLAICQDRWVAGISLVPMNLRTLGQASQTFFASRNWQCHEMVNFAGDRQAALLIRLPDRIVYHGDLDIQKVSYVGFHRN